MFVEKLCIVSKDPPFFKFYVNKCKTGVLGYSQIFFNETVKEPLKV